MPIPHFEQATGYLPAGTHPATLNEIRQRFGTGRRRGELFAHLEVTVTELKNLGVVDIWLGGSFVTDKQRPGDIDLIYMPPPGAVIATWGPLSPQRRGDLKAARQIDLWNMPSPQPAKSHGLLSRISIKDFFSSDPNGHPKGLIHLLTEEAGDDH